MTDRSPEEPWWFPKPAEGGATPLGWKYKDTWDCLKDAREEYECLADAYLDLVLKPNVGGHDETWTKVGDALPEGDDVRVYVVWRAPDRKYYVRSGVWKYGCFIVTGYGVSTAVSHWQYLNVPPLPKEIEFKEKTVAYDSDEAAQIKTVTGWFDRYGHFWGNDEHMARYSGCTHKKCECGATISRSEGYICNSCRAKKKTEQYYAMPVAAWDGQSWIYSEATAKYYADMEEVIDDMVYIKEGEDAREDMRLIQCSPNTTHELDFDFFDDAAYDGMDDVLDVLPEEVKTAYDALNKELGKNHVISWSPGKMRLDTPKLPHTN